MELAGSQLLGRCLVLSILSSAAGLPLPAGSPEKIVAVSGKEVRLPCSVGGDVDYQKVMVEWFWTDGESRLQVHIQRQGSSLTKEQAVEYRGRTAVKPDCSLRLRELRLRDAGTYKCVLRGAAGKEASVSLVVVEVFEVNLSVQRTSDNQLIVRCRSSGWSQEPAVSLLDSQRNPLTNQTEPSVQQDGLYSVQASLNLTAAAVTIRNGTLICRAEISGMNLWNETKIDLTDEFHSNPNTSLVCGGAHGHTGLVVLGVFLFLLGVVVGVGIVVIVVRYRKQGFAQISSDDSLDSDPSQNELLLPGGEGFTEYGDINKVDTTGASEDTAKANRLEGKGIEASGKIAEQDNEEVEKFKEQIISVGRKLKVHPALIAAIISRQSQAGKKLRKDGFGIYDSNCFGLMQINKAYHAVTGGPYSEEHVQQGVVYLIQLIKIMERKKESWTKEQRLKGALVSYIAGEDKVIDLDYEKIDSVTPHEDFANDVIARAQWFAVNGY